MLNISPIANGTINKEQRDLLTTVGGWLDIYGEAVYGTRSFHIYGFGHAKAADGAHGGQSAKVEYNAGDVRFTTSKDKKALYVFLLGKPEVGEEISLGKMNNINILA